MDFNVSGLYIYAVVFQAERARYRKSHSSGVAERCLFFHIFPLLSLSLSFYRFYIYIFVKNRCLIFYMCLTFYILSFQAEKDFKDLLFAISLYLIYIFLNIELLVIICYASNIKMLSVFPTNSLLTSTLACKIFFFFNTSSIL